MSITGGDGSGILAAHAARRWQLIDPLLPEPEAVLPAGEADDILVSAGGWPVAAGRCRHWAGSPDSLDLTWGAARRFELTAHIPGPEVGQPLDLLLHRWREHLAGEPEAAGPDSAAVITWPSRDIGGVRTLLQHGFAPLAVIAARHAGTGSAAGAAASAGRWSGTTDPGVRVRRAESADLDVLVRLGLEAIRFDSCVSAVTERPQTAAALRRELGGLLAAPGHWIWLAERGGTAVGMLAAERPETAQWIAPLVRADPVAYLLLMGVAADQRGAGVGAALAAQLNHEVEAAGVEVTLLHYAQVNPLSAPFWSQQGYRPLWTVWEATPGVTFR